MSGRFEVIPALDLRGGQVVRLRQGDYDRETVYDADPGARAARFVAEGAPRLHVIDLDGAREGVPTSDPALREVLAAAKGVPVQVGGGIRSLERIEALLELGAQRVILGTIALEAPRLLREAALRFPEQVILGLDARDGRVAVRGWTETGVETVERVLERFADLPLAALLHTDIRRDGMLSGANLEATAELARVTQIPVLASGGVSSLADLAALARSRVIAGVIVGRALYDGAFELAAALDEVASC